MLNIYLDGNQYDTRYAFIPCALVACRVDKIISNRQVPMALDAVVKSRIRAIIVKAKNDA
jgi:hypothetical protein